MKPPIENVPQCLRDLPQWVCWRYVERHGKRTKVPINARTGRNASAVDAATWTTFEAAHEAYLRADSLAGIGFVLTKDDPFAGVDLDRCLDESGKLIWGQDIIEQLDTYTEISPSGRGVKLFLRATKPAFAKCRRDRFGADGTGELELYDQARFFCVTGHPLAHTRTQVADRQLELDAICARLWPNVGPQETEQKLEATIIAAGDHSACLQSMLAMRLVDKNDGSYRLFSAGCRCVEHNLSDADAVACLRAYERYRPFPRPWSDAEIVKRLRDAERHCRRGAAAPVTIVTPSCKDVEELLMKNPDLRPPIIHGLLRRGETMNGIAASKMGKSWLIYDLAMAIVTGRSWLDTFQTEPGNVLILDNELHTETLANRIPRVAEARGIPITKLYKRMYVEPLRGKLRDIFSLAPYFQALQPGFFQVIVLDAFYRFLPKDIDENSNSSLTDVYNQLDSYADQLGCAFVLVHHASKGTQSGKSVTDVGAGAGSLSRATDTHLILRPHEQDSVVVMEAVVRSFPPIAPRCLRWTFPVWTPDDLLDPRALRSDYPRRPKRADDGKPANEWDAERIAELASESPAQMLTLIAPAIAAGLSERKAKSLVRQAEAAGLLFRWTLGPSLPVEFATVPQNPILAKAS